MYRLQHRVSTTIETSRLQAPAYAACCRSSPHRHAFDILDQDRGWRWAVVGFGVFFRAGVSFHSIAIHCGSGKLASSPHFSQIELSSRRFLAVHTSLRDPTVARGRVKGIITVDDDLGQTTGPTPVRACPEIPEKAELLGAATCTALAKSFRGAACCARTQHYVIVDMGTPTLVASSKFKSNESTGNAGPESMIYAVRKLHITMVLLCFVAAATPARALQCAAQAQLCRIQCDDQWLASQTCVGMSDTQKSSCYYNASTNLRDCRHYCVTNYCSAGQAPHQGGHGWAQARPRGQ